VCLDRRRDELAHYAAHLARWAVRLRLQEEAASQKQDQAEELRRLLGERDLRVGELLGQLEEARRAAAGREAQEAELRRLRDELEAGRRDLDEQCRELEEWQAELDEAARQGEEQQARDRAQLARERAETNRERSELERLRAEVRVGQPREARETAARDRLAALRQQLAGLQPGETTIPGKPSGPGKPPRSRQLRRLQGEDRPG
jgi:hypothetical protein